MLKCLALILAMLFIPALARADEITYTYTGPAPADLSGSFTVAAPLTPRPTVGFAGNVVFTSIPFDPGFNAWSVSMVTSFMFTDGIDVWTPANSVLGGNADVTLDGNLAVWSFSLTNPVTGQTLAYSQTEITAFYYQDDTPVGDSWVANQFTWNKPKGSFTVSDTDAVATPEPGSLLLLAVGLAALALAIHARGNRWTVESLLARFNYFVRPSRICS